MGLKRDTVGGWLQLWLPLVYNIELQWMKMTPQRLPIWVIQGSLAKLYHLGVEKKKALGEKLKEISPGAEKAETLQQFISAAGVLFVPLV